MILKVGCEDFVSLRNISGQTQRLQCLVHLYMTTILLGSRAGFQSFCPLKCRCINDEAVTLLSLPELESICIMVGNCTVYITVIIILHDNVLHLQIEVFRTCIKFCFL